MLLSRPTVLLALTAAAAARPLEKKWLGGITTWLSPASLIDFAKRQTWGGSNIFQQAQCDLSSAQLPPSSLDAPSDGLKLYHVAVGQGTQNYTCDTSNPTAAPVAVGALASLFNVTCWSASIPAFVDAMPAIAMVTESDKTAPAYEELLSGHHYFTDNTTPFFNLDTSTADFGAGAFKKLGSAAAPASAPQGKNGAVPWLKLAAKNPGQCAFSEVYRVNTAGGAAPPTCSGQQSSFEIAYGAEYWFYA